MTSSSTAPPATPKETTATAGPGRRNRSSSSRRELPDTVKCARLSSISGVIFAVLFVVALVLVHTTPTLSASDADITAFYTSSSTALVTVGLYLIPLAGIVFLWHAHATRLLIKSRTPSPSAIADGLQLVSGVLFVVLLFAGTASAGSVALLKDLTSAPLPSPDFVRGMLAVGYGMVFIYSLRGAGMYLLTTTRLLREAEIMPKWLGLASYLLGAFLLLGTLMHPAVMLLFPGWVIVIGLVVFIRAGRVAEPSASETQASERQSA
jgi:hypothetical protein